MGTENRHVSSDRSAYPQTKLVKIAEGATLFEQGSNGREMYIIRSGRVQVSITKKGESVPITELGPGSFVGEMSFIADIPRTATVTALEPVIASSVSADILSGDSLSISGWAISVARVLVDRLKRTTELLGDYRINHSHSQSVQSGERGKVDGATTAFEQTQIGHIIKLRGILTSNNLNTVKFTVRKSLLQHADGIVIDFSGVIDLDTDALGYLLQLAESPQAKDGRIQLRNMQLIRNRVTGMKAIRDLIESSDLPLRRVEAGRCLIRQGDRERSMFVVKSGEFDIVDEHDPRHPILLGKSRAGDVLGEMCLLHEGERSATARAKRTSMVLEITPNEFFSNAYTIPDWFMQIIEELVERLRNTDEMLSQMNSPVPIVRKRPPSRNALRIEVDGADPACFTLGGTLNLPNIKCLAPLIRHLMNTGSKDITIKLNELRQIDSESIGYFLKLHALLRKNGGSLNLEGTQKQMLWLKEHGSEDTIARRSDGV